MNPRYKVLYAEAVREAVRALLRRAAALGIQPEVAAALRTIDQQLRTDPSHFGDVYTHLQGWTKYLRVQQPLFLHYAVSHFLQDDQYLVYVSTISPLSGHGL
jgi:hypothetical protein